jgi:phospholipid/cholesterol/gamma-HCH transport system ATP-binding protein
MLQIPEKEAAATDVGVAAESKCPPAIEFRDVDLAFDDLVILDKVSFKVESGETRIVLGGSGTGKSTIINLILGLLKPDGGQIIINGQDITDFDDMDLMKIRKRVGMIFQEGALFDSLSVYENVAYRLHEEGIDEDEVEHEVRRMLQFVGLEDAIDKMPSELSGGMRRRVGIARALAGDPDIVLFDEPTAGLDPPTARTICELAIKLRDIESVTSIFVTHEMDNLGYLSNEYAVIDEKGDVQFEREGNKLCIINTSIMMLRGGKIIFEGTDEQLQRVDDSYIRRFVSPSYV